MLNLGITAFTHDSAAALVDDGEIVCAVEEERLSRVKHTGVWPARAIDECLRHRGARLRDVDTVAFYWDPWLTVRSRFGNSLRHSPRYLARLCGNGPEAAGRPVRGSVSALVNMMRLRNHLSSMYGDDARAVRIEYVPHHLAHAASAFLASPFERAAIWTVDGTGERDTSLLAAGTAEGIEVLQRTPYPHSLGVLYGALTQYLGFRVADEEWKVMALAAYGQPRHHESLSRLVRLRDDGTLRLDLDYFRFQYPGEPVWFSPRLVELLGPARAPAESPLAERFVDIAASLQQLTKEIALHAVRRLHAASPQENLTVAGGVALNASVNDFLVEHSPFKRIFIPPAPYDAGCAPGAALYIHQRRGGSRRVPMRHAYLGPVSGCDDIERALNESGLHYRRVPDICRCVARLLSEQKVVGWFQGRMEFGPRALGNRSILADPREQGMRDRVNEKVKFRERFRPFAPSVLAERFEQFFEGAPMSPFMLFLRDAKPEVRERIPAVLHVDGTARVQLVESSVNPRFHQLLTRFDELTGIPMLLNTSFNTAEEPIVCSPQDAIRSFLRSGLDALAMDDFLVSKADVAVSP